MSRAVAILLVALATATAHASPCGEERAAVKLGLDAEAVRLSTEPYDTTVARLVALPRPGRIPESTRAGDVERMVWRVEGTMVAYKLETDGDFHVVLADEHGVTLIVEVPAPQCTESGAWGEQVAAARAAFLSMLSARGFPAPSKRLRRTRIPVRVSGFGFYDRLHGQVGVAANGVELHPVLAIEAGGGK